jgi:hypothetical protein
MGVSIGGAIIHRPCVDPGTEVWPPSRDVTSHEAGVRPQQLAAPRRGPHAHGLAPEDTPPVADATFWLLTTRLAPVRHDQPARGPRIVEALDRNTV